ncbi:MAG: MFS transporter [bacterium]
MLVTRQNQIPFLWLIMITVPWALFYFMIQVNGVNFFILNRLIDNPAALTFFFSLPGLIFLFIPVGPYISFMSDRIWTRWGRRKIFLIINFSAMALVMFFYPLAPNVWAFLALMCIAAFIGAFGTPFEALKLEIIPPDMRGRSSAMNTWVNTIINIVFSLAVIGRFDEVIPFLGGQISGIKILYWSAALGLLIVVFYYFFGIHEVHPRSTITGEKFNIKKAWKAMTIPQLRYLYIFMIATTLLGASLGSLGTLLYINQWGYSFQEMGINIAFGGIINLFLIPIIGIFADKGRQHRMRIWLTCVGIVSVLTLSYFAFVTWYLPDQRPSLVEIIFFGETTCIVGIIGGMVYYPLVYDYIPRNLMGTYSAGCGIVAGIVGFFTTNGLGVFLLCWAKLFQPPAGEMVRVCLETEMQQPQVAQILYLDHLVTPDGAPAATRDIVARPWYANGIVKDNGVCYEIRLRDADGEAKMKRRDELKNTIDALDAKTALDRKRGSAGDTMVRREKELEALCAENEQLKLAIEKRSAQWRAEVLRGLDQHLMKEGTALLSNTPARAVVSLVLTTRKPKDKEVDQLNKRLRAEDPAAISLGSIRLERGFAFSVSTLLPADKDPNDIMRALCQRLIRLGDETAPGLMAHATPVSAVAIKPAAVIELALVEDPVRNFMSPISRVMNALLSRFVDLPPPDQKLISLARNVCKGGLISHARTAALAGRNGVHLIVVADDETVGDRGVWTAKVLDRIRLECASLKLTVPAPVIDQGVVPLKYNYMSGYLYVFALVICGFGLVMYFIHQEKIGVVKKWGAEEARSDKQMNTPLTSMIGPEAGQVVAPVRVSTSSPETYTPGYLIPKVIFALAGLLVVGVAFKQAWPDLRLLAVGRPTEAIAVSVVASKPGQPDFVMKNQAELNAKMKAVSNAKDYSWTFYNEFVFEATDGQEVAFRRGVGCKLKPSMPLLDENGLPTTAKLFYDPKVPTRTVLPLEYSTWLAPALTAILGLMAFVLGAVFAWFATKPITLSANAAVNLTGDGSKRD